MVTALSSQEMRELENAAFESGAASSRDLMEAAGKGVVDALVHQWPDAVASRASALVLCRPGNNGGDGFVVARHLVKLGYEVQVFFYGKRQNLSDDARYNHDLWFDNHTGVSVLLEFPEPSLVNVKAIEAAFEHNGPLLVVDALFGIGLDRPLTALEPVIKAHRKRRDLHPLPMTYCVAVDVPSGLSDDGPVGAGDYSVMQADLTVTFHQIKKAHVAAPGLCGVLHVHDIGL